MASMVLQAVQRRTLQWARPLRDALLLQRGLSNQVSLYPAASIYPAASASGRLFPGAPAHYTSGASVRIRECSTSDPQMAVAGHKVAAGKVYWVGLSYPDFLNDASLQDVPEKVADWFTKKAVAQRREVRRIRHHIGLVLRVDSLPGGQYMAVILLGTFNPRQQHRYLPLHGSPQLEYQPPASIRPTPVDAFFYFPGYLNFTHALQVRVLGPHELQDRRAPGECHLEKHFYDKGQQLEITVEPTEIENIRTHHLSYWEGKRYGKDGSEAPKGNEEADPKDTELTKRLSTNIVETKNYANVLALKSKTVCKGGGSSVTSGGGGNVTSDDDPVHPVTGDKFSIMIRRAMINEDIRATQIELMDLDFPLDDDYVPIVGEFFPVSHDFLSLFPPCDLEV